MSPSIALQLAALVAIGFGAQWLAWRIRMPAIVFLLLIGIVLGPGLDLLHPQEALGDLFFPFISFGVAIILFEGSCTLRFSELAGVGGTVLRLVSLGAVATLAVLAAAAHWIAGLSWEVAALFGALTCVTGPTVVIPMLRSVRPNARIARVLQWEGIIIDPIGALFAVLVYEAILSRQSGHSIGVFLLTIGLGCLAGLIGAMLLTFLLRRRWLPEYLQSFGTLALVLLTFALANEGAHESGLVAVTVMGMILANMPRLAIGEILSFKEHLSTLLVSALFILLAARLRWPLPDGALMAGVALLLVAQFIARPLAVLLSSIGGRLDWRERALVAWIAPRGIVAAAISSLFALRLEEQGPAGVELLVPLTFMLIIGTVLLQGATARSLARWLGVLEPSPRGVLVVGATSPAVAVAGSLHAQGVPVLLADDDWNGVAAARMKGTPTWFGDPLTSHASRELDLTGLGRLFAMSGRRERNSLACVRFQREFGRDRLWRLRVLPRDHDRRREHHDSIRAPRLFGRDVTLGMFEQRLADGWVLKTTRISENYDRERFEARWGGRALPLFSLDDKGRLHVVSEDDALKAEPGWTVTALVPPAILG